MKNTLTKQILCVTILISFAAIKLDALADSVETTGVLNASGGVRFPDGNVQTSACTGCAGGILTVPLGGTGANNALDARENLGVPGLITPNTFTASQIVTGTVSATSFAGSGAGLTSLNAASLASGTVPDARLPSNLARKYSRVAVVAVSGGDYTSPVDAMTAYTWWCGVPSATNPCLLKIMPGVYNLGSTSLSMRSYVDIEGAGETATVINGTVGSGSTPPANGLVNGASNAELRFLTVKNTGGGGNVAAVLNSGASPRMTHMTASASGGTNLNSGVYNYTSSPAMNNVTASASGGAFNSGVYNDSSSPAMNNVTASASGGTTSSYGVYNVSSSSPIMSNITASASGGANNYGVLNLTSSPAMNSVSASAASGGTASNYGVKNSTSSPVMNNVTASASDGEHNYGVNNSYSSPAMNNVTASASGGIENYGVYNDHSSPAMSNMSATTSGGESNGYAVWNDSSSPTMTNVIASASGGAYPVCVWNHASSGTYTIKIDRSTLSSSTYSIFNDSHFTLKIGATNLKGPVNAVGTYNCVGVYDSDTYTALNATCQ